MSRIMNSKQKRRLSRCLFLKKTSSLFYRTIHLHTAQFNNYRSLVSQSAFAALLGIS